MYTHVDITGFTVYVTKYSFITFFVQDFMKLFNIKIECKYLLVI